MLVRTALTIALCAALAGCVYEPVPFEVELENAASGIRYLDQWGDRLDAELEIEYGGEWAAVRSAHPGCGTPRCAEPPAVVGTTVCRGSGIVPPETYALLPGDSVVYRFDADQAIIIDPTADRTCSRRVNLSGPVRLRVCHSGAADGAEEAEPEASGVVDDGPSLDDPICDELEFELDEADQRYTLELQP